jgi:hypothetical protein
MADIDWDECSDAFQGKGTFFAVVLCDKDGTPCHVFSEFYSREEAADCIEHFFGGDQAAEHTFFITETTKAFVLDPCHSIYHVGREFGEMLVPRDEPGGSA